PFAEPASAVMSVILVSRNPCRAKTTSAASMSRWRVRSPRAVRFLAILASSPLSERSSISATSLILLAQINVDRLLTLAPYSSYRGEDHFVILGGPMSDANVAHHAANWLENLSRALTNRDRDGLAKLFLD